MAGTVLIHASELKICPLECFPIIMFIWGSHAFAMFSAHALHGGRGHACTVTWRPSPDLLKIARWGACLHCMTYACSCIVWPYPQQYTIREESIERAIWPVQEVFGKSRTRNSNIDQWERSIQIDNYGRGLKCKRDSEKEHSWTKLTKNASTFHSPEKIECLAPWLSHVCKAGSHVILWRHITGGIWRVRYSLPLRIMNSCLYLIPSFAMLHIEKLAFQCATLQSWEQGLG